MATVNMELKVLPVINYAMHQNGTAALQSVTLENTAQEALENVTLTVTATPGFCLPMTRHIDCLPPHKAVTLANPELLLDASFLSGTTEKVTGTLQFTLTQGETELATQQVQTTVLAFDQWHGIGMYPELLAAFVTPNHPTIGRIIARATEFLGKWTGDTSMDGYQSQDPNRVLSQAAALFTALKEQAIAYVVPPASFEETGQRIRLCDTVLQQKLGTCIDLTLLYASCLEAVGLHPLLITTPGHIYTGLWLEDKMFPECVQDDVSLITKRLASGVNEIAVIETTCVTTGADRSFDDARHHGEQNLSNKPLEYIIDVRRARLSHVSPLPQRIHTEAGWVVEHDASFQPKNLRAPEQLDETIHIDPNLQDDTIPKKVQWERKLLDLGMRNTLINLRLTKSHMPILTGSLDALENGLNSGSDFTILPRPQDWQAESITFEGLQELGSAQIIQADFQNKRLRTVLSDSDLSRSIKELYRSAKSSLEENGANTLYLALGVLKWFESKRSTKARYAPIILLPIEMVRKSAAQGYVIRLRDDEPQMNITLLEKLKQDFGIVVNGVDPLPTDEQGIDIRRVLTIMRHAIMEQPHWDVLETASIGIFSFSQFVMWNDIRNRTDDLLRNKIVRSLMDGKLCWDAQSLEVGARVSEDGVLLPMPADASQLYAIEAACNGQSFVLHGPPGTGKSQTITSLIANALAQGKQVLFVAEKMAALEVVQKRLDAIGIGPFCLELHSNKSKKRDVLEQLRQATEITKTVSPQAYAARAEKLAAMRQELDQYARELHKPLNCGSDLYGLINQYEACRDAAEIAPFQRVFLQHLTPAKLEQHQLALERLTAAGRDAGHPCGHGLKDITCTQFTQALRVSLPELVGGYAEALEAIIPYASQAATLLNQPEPESFDSLSQLVTVAGYLSCWFTMPVAWRKADVPRLYFKKVGYMAQHFQNEKALRQQVLQQFSPEVLQVDAQAMYQSFADAYGKWFLPKTLNASKLTKQLNQWSKTPITKEDLKSRLTLLRNRQAEETAARELLSRYQRDLGDLYNGYNTPWEQIQALADSALESAQAIFDLYGSCDPIRNLDNSNKELLLGLKTRFEALVPARTAFFEQLGVSQQARPHWLHEQIAACQRILANADSLKQWIAYNAAAQEAKVLGLGNAVDLYETGADHEQLLPCYRKALLQGLIANAMDESDTLNQFSGAVFNEKLQQYKRMDQEWTALSRQETYCRLAAKVPNFTKEAAQSSELGVLQRCIKSGGRGTSIRKLFDQIPHLLPRLCPCMLMSPISAAQYLDPKREPFDIVVFDEASQLPTCKAVGVLARGKDAVIVGDPKQMPPTSFFATNTVDEDNLDIEDLESILDDCLALNMPQAHLLWHYRSRHESLIAFSNSRFYDNKLFTFPSVNDRESKVRLVHVDGVFARGKSRVNRQEAQAVVTELQRRCHDPLLHSQSVGVVTFNISQQNLIDDLLNEACAQDPELEKWAYGSEEPVFIKNLENVQGDERDVILFSIGYGPDENGKIYMNFGPLNRDGGWRRLNVAVSRARCEMVVFSTLRAEQIDLNRSQAEGVKALRAFLEYAEGRPIAMNEAEAQSYHPEKAGIATAICKALDQAGYDADVSIGRSEYHVDIGVIDPQKPDRYLLGILLDGEGYGTAKTTRDREIAQIGVLNGLGWNIHRLWCMDWWDNRQKELERILARLEELKNAPEAPVPMASPVVVAAPVKVAPMRVAAGAPSYTAMVFPAAVLSAENFLEPRYEKAIRQRIEQVIKAEAPISAGLLTRRVVQSYGIARAGSRLQAHMTGLLAKMALNVDAQDFYWRKNQEPEAWPGFRINGTDEDHRDVRELPVQEVSNAICTVLYEQISMIQEDLLREAAKQLGYTRLGGNVLATLETGLEYAQAHFFVERNDHGAFLLTGSGMSRAEETARWFQTPDK